ncbi:MAG: ABC transporter permease [Armatimonadota bacterium]|nr:ABC transporter permease [Armatimonadota bacterium]
MLRFVLRRVLLMIPALLVVSALVFTIIQLQPGGFLTQYLEDPRFSPQTVETITRQFGLDEPPHIQYLRWIQGVVTRGDFGYSFLNGRPVGSLIWERVGWTIFLAGLTIACTWVIAIPLGIYTAVRPRGAAATAVNFVSYVGQATPDFLLALLLVAMVLSRGGTNVGGLFSPQYIDAPWGWAKARDMLAHLWIPIAAISLEGVAGLMRQMRAKMLDVLGADYVRTARAKGVPGQAVLWRHAVRNAINPLVSLAGLSLPGLISSTILVSIVLNLPTIGPFLYDSLLNKDQYVVTTLLLISSLLLMVGNLLADLALVWIDPRIRYQ